MFLPCCQSNIVESVRLEGITGMRAIQKSQATLEGETIGANGRLIGGNDECVAWRTSDRGTIGKVVFMYPMNLSY
jgi:hypothetical protein